MICRNAARSAELCPGVGAVWQPRRCAETAAWERKAIFPQRQATVKIRQCAFPLQDLRVRGMSNRSRRCVSREAM
jgi:hypothetical protein